MYVMYVMYVRKCMYVCIHVCMYHVKAYHVCNVCICMYVCMLCMPVLYVSCNEATIIISYNLVDVWNMVLMSVALNLAFCSEYVM